MKKRQAEYKQRGDYHRNLDEKWFYYPVYVEKMKYVEQIMDRIPKDKKIVDLGCGEGLLVEKYSSSGKDIVGIDLNYESDLVKKGDILSTGYEDSSFDVVVCLDVLEHLDFTDQQKAIDEIFRILSPEGKLILSVPNLAHFASRFSFLLMGRLLRTSKLERHPGDRPAYEYRKMIEENFSIRSVKGLFPTLPIISFLTLISPKGSLILHKIYNRLTIFPYLCFLNIYIAEPKKNEK